MTNVRRTQDSPGAEADPDVQVDDPPLTCRCCELTKPTSEFLKHGYRCKECKKAQQREYYRRTNGLDRIRRNNWARYGVTPEAYAAMFQSQDGGCAICGEPPGKRALHIDHCHDTGVVRGLLCQGCNVALASAGERPEVLRKCADYLERHSPA